MATTDLIKNKLRYVHLLSSIQSAQALQLVKVWWYQVFEFQLLYILFEYALSVNIYFQNENFIRNFIKINFNFSNVLYRYPTILISNISTSFESVPELPSLGIIMISKCIFCVLFCLRARVNAIASQKLQLKSLLCERDNLKTW